MFGIFGAASHAGALALRLIYGHDSDSGDKSLIEVTEQAMLMMTKIVVPAAIIVNTFPFCELEFNNFPCFFKRLLTEPPLCVVNNIPQLVPGINTFHDFARQSRELVDEMINRPFIDVKARMVS